MDEDVAGTDRREHVGRLVLVGRDEARRRDRRPRRHLEVRPVEVHELAQPGQVEHPADLVAVVLAQPEAVEQDAPCRRRHRSLDLEPDRFAETPPPQLLLDRHEQVVGLVLLDREVGVARHPEEVVIEDLHAEEQGIQVGLDHLVDEHEPRRLDHDQARQDLGDLDPREAALAALRVAQSDRDRQAQRRDVRERMARVDRERREDGEDLLEEPLAERLVVLRDRGVVHDLDPLLGERRADVERDSRVVRDQLEHPLADRCELVLGGPAVRRQRGLARLDLLAQAGDPDLEELVEIAREDREELDPLEQRVALVARLVQHPRVEFQPGQLAIDVRERGLRTCRPPRTPNLRSRDGSGLDGSHAVRLCSLRWDARGRLGRPRAGEDSTRA